MLRGRSMLWFLFPKHKRIRGGASLLIGGASSLTSYEEHLCWCPCWTSSLICLSGRRLLVWFYFMMFPLAKGSTVLIYNWIVFLTYVRHIAFQLCLNAIAISSCYSIFTTSWSSCIVIVMEMYIIFMYLTLLWIGMPMKWVNDINDFTFNQLVILIVLI